MRSNPPIREVTRKRALLNRLLSTAGTILIVSCPAAVLAQVVTNAARVAAPVGSFDPIAGNNSAIDSDALLALIAASNDNYPGIRGGVGNPNLGNVLSNDRLNGAVIDPALIALRIVTPASDPGVVLDPITGQVSVGASVAAGTYAIVYELCERANPTNCAQATVTITVDPAISAVSGTVFDDGNVNRNIDSGENLRGNWIVEIIKDGAVVATTRTDASGNYRFDGLLSGSGYLIQFRNPESNVVFRVIPNVTLIANATLQDQNLPLDPSGVVYDSITRSPVRNAVVTLLGANGAPLPGVCFISVTQQSQPTDSSGLYRFDLLPGAAPQCPVGETVYTIAVAPPTGYSAPSSVLPAEPGAFDPTGRPGPVMIGAAISAPTGSEPVRWYQSFRLASGDPDVIFNHIPLDPFTLRAPLVVTKTSIKRTANVGDLIPYTITVRNTEAAQRGAVDVVDILPPGLKYVPGSASVNGVAGEPLVSDRELRWERQIIPGNGTVTYKLTAVVGAGVTTGDRVNTGVARNDLDDGEISNRGQAVVSIVPSTVFDCAEVIGKVYEDLNGNGYQDAGERGIPGARLATVNGELITTDEFGRYHIACAAVPDAAIGSNFVLKLDVRTVPVGYSPTTDNPQSIRLTRGKISELNFGVQKAPSTALDLDQNAFLPGTATLKPEIVQKLATLRPKDETRLVFQITYRAQSGEDWALAEKRAEAVKTALAAQFSKDWDADAPVIEANVTRAFGMPGRE